MVKAVKSFSQFDKGMARVEALMGGKKESGLRREVKALAGEFGLASDELVNGLYNALSAGVPKGNVIEFLRTAAKAAVADGSDISTSVDGITTVLNAFKLESGEAGKVADVMFKTVAKGKTNFAELSANIANVAPLAAASGVAFEEVFAAVATLTKQGTPTAQAMTQIRAALLSVNEQLGDGWSETMTLQEAFGALSDKAGGSSTELKKLMGRVEGVMAVLGTTGQNAAGAAVDLKDMADAAGLLDEAMEGSLDQAKVWDKLGANLKSIWQDVGASLTESLLPWLNTINKGMSELREAQNLQASAEAGEDMSDRTKAGQRIWKEMVGDSAFKDLPMQHWGQEWKDEFKKRMDAYDAPAIQAKIQATVDAEIAAAAEAVRIDEEKHQKMMANAAEMSANHLKLIEQQDAKDAEALKKKLAHEDAANQRAADRLAAKREKEREAELAAGKKMAKQAQAALFIDVPETFKQGFDAFVGRRDAAGLAQEDNTKLLKKVEDAKARQARGVKRQGDAKLLADVAAFKKAEAMRKKAEDDILQVQKDIRDNLKKNLEAAQKAV
jgi:TP901 family phage tail tape measure protein